MTRFWSNFVKKCNNFYFWRCSMPAASPYIKVHGAQSRYLQLEIVFREAALHIIVVYVDYNILIAQRACLCKSSACPRALYLKKKKKKFFPLPRLGVTFCPSVCLSVRPSVRPKPKKIKCLKSTKKHFVFVRN